MKIVYKTNIKPLIASEIMSNEVKTIYSFWTVKEASIFLEKINHTGAPVVNEKITLLDFLH